MRERLKAAALFITGLCWLIAMAATIGAYHRCEARGGTFVRDIVWYTCINEVPRD